jgi:hypothetical protein
MRDVVECQAICDGTRTNGIHYSGYNRDQELDRVDFENLSPRLRQNSVQEKLSNRWLDLLLTRDRIGRA